MEVKQRQLPPPLCEQKGTMVPHAPAHQYPNSCPPMVLTPHHWYATIDMAPTAQTCLLTTASIISSICCSAATCQDQLQE